MMMKTMAMMMMPTMMTTIVMIMAMMMNVKTFQKGSSGAFSGLAESKTGRNPGQECMKSAQSTICLSSLSLS